VVQKKGNLWGENKSAALASIWTTTVTIDSMNNEIVKQVNICLGHTVVLLKSSGRYCMCEEQTDIKDVKLYFLTAKLVTRKSFLFLHIVCRAGRYGQNIITIFFSYHMILILIFITKVISYSIIKGEGNTFHMFVRPQVLVYK